MYHKVKDEEQIKYFDFTSLYPYVQKYRTFPIGHPEIIIKNFNDISEYFGFVKLKILAPYKFSSLYLSVLPIKAINGKLLFALCQACANNQSFECNHCDEERAILGTYCTEEVKEALKNGYKIYEVWHFKEKSNDLFVKYINMFLKHKQQSSGFPSNVNTEGNISKMKK